MALMCICSLLGRQSELQLSGEQHTLDGRPINHPNPAFSCLMLINYHTGNCPRTSCRLSFHICWQYRLHVPTNTLEYLKRSDQTFNSLLQIVILLEFFVQAGQVITDNAQFNFLNGVQYPQGILKERPYPPARAITGNDGVVKNNTPHYSDLFLGTPCAGEKACTAVGRLTGRETDEEFLTRVYTCFKHVAVFDNK